MGPTEIALVGLVAWSLALTLMIGALRSALVMRGRRKANQFAPDGADVSPFAHRLARAHANCYENLPLIGALLLYAIATDRTQVTDPLALVYLNARFGQSIVHLVSTSNPAVLVRFGFFLVQLAVMAWYCWNFLPL